jgi:hypothetical protein
MWCLEIDIEYANGWRETITLREGETFKIPFNGKIIATRPAWKENSTAPGTS